MAEQSKPNTFSGGMKTDLDPAYQPKDSYDDAINIRVVTNGDRSYSLENIQGPKLKNTTTGGSTYSIRGAVIIEDYIITLQREDGGANNWKIIKTVIDSDGNLGSDSLLWGGTNLFNTYAGRIEIESIVETENIHRIYCTDGMIGLRSINVKDPGLVAKGISDFEAFKPSVKSKISLEDYEIIKY